MSEPKTTTTAVDPAYLRLPTVGDHAPRIGSALITWVEPMPDHVVGYARWYEDEPVDHRPGDCRPIREAISCLLCPE